MSILISLILIFVLMIITIFIDTLFQYTIVPFGFPWEKKHWNKSIFPSKCFTWKINKITRTFDAPHTYQGLVLTGLGSILFIYGKYISAPCNLPFWLDALIFILWIFLVFYNIRNLSLKVFKRNEK